MLFVMNQKEAKEALRVRDTKGSTGTDRGEKDEVGEKLSEKFKYFFFTCIHSEALLGDGFRFHSP